MIGKVSKPGDASAHVLIVDDNPVTRDAYRALLEVAGYRVDTAADCGSAIALARHAPPDVVVQDMHLPDGDGFDLASRLRKLDGHHAPLLACSGYLDSVDPERLAAAGFTDMLVKPVDPERLLQAVAQALSARTNDVSAAARTDAP